MRKEVTTILTMLIAMIALSGTAMANDYGILAHAEGSASNGESASSSSSASVTVNGYYSTTTANVESGAEGSSVMTYAGAYGILDLYNYAEACGYTGATASGSTAWSEADTTGTLDYATTSVYVDADAEGSPDSVDTTAIVNTVASWYIYENGWNPGIMSYGFATASADDTELDVFGTADAEAWSFFQYADSYVEPGGDDADLYVEAGAVGSLNVPE